MNVAQLKLQGEGQRCSPRNRSHVRMNVAQLKHTLIKRETFVRSRFPRSNERGSIEAISHSSNCKRTA
jgi:hypothetical protein